MIYSPIWEISLNPYCDLGGSALYLLLAQNSHHTNAWFRPAFCRNQVLTIRGLCYTLPELSYFQLPASPGDTNLVKTQIPLPHFPLLQTIRPLKSSFAKEKFPFLPSLSILL